MDNMISGESVLLIPTPVLKAQAIPVMYEYVPPSTIPD